MAYHAARQCLPAHSSRFSRHDFTLPQLFACLAIREHMGCSYRRTEALLKDCWPWCRDIGMPRAPDHATLHRASQWLMRGRRMERLLDLLHQWLMLLGKLGTTCAIDSTLYDTHHRSRHYEQRIRHRNGRQDSDKRRSFKARRTPKLTIALDVRMLKRNLGDALRCRSDGPRQRELVLRSLVHNIMLIGAAHEGSRQSRTRTVIGR